MLTPTPSIGDSDNGTGNFAEDDSDTSGSDVDISDIDSTGV